MLEIFPNAAMSGARHKKSRLIIGSSNYHEQLGLLDKIPQNPDLEEMS